MASQKIHHIFPMEYKIYTDRLPATATVVTTVKDLTCSNWLQDKGEHEHSIVMASSIKLEVIIICNCTSPHGSIYYIVAFKVHSVVH